MSVSSRVLNYSDSDSQPASQINSDYSCDSFSHKLLKTYKGKHTESTEIDRIQFQLKTNTKWNPISFQEVFVDPLPTDRKIYHDGYIEYLVAALSHGYGIEVAPWLIWNVILREIWEMINTNPDRYQKLLSRNLGVIQLVQTSEFKIECCIEQMKNLVPFDLSKLYPQLIHAPANWLNSMYGLLNVTTEKSELQPKSQQTLTKVDLLGSPQDWHKLTNALISLIESLQKFDPINELCRYLIQCLHQLKEIELNFDDRSYWKDFVSLRANGLQGHILAFLQSGQTKKMVSKYPYANSRGEQYYFISGLMCSQLDYNQILRPEYHCLTAKVVSIQKELSSAERSQLEIQLRYLQIIQKYDLRNAYKSYQYEVYNEKKRQYESVSRLECQCEWFREDERPANSYISGSLEETLYHDHFRMTQQLIIERSDPRDMKFLTDHIDLIYDFIVKDGQLPETIIHAFIYTFDIYVIEALLSTHLKRNPTQSDTLAPKLITSIIRHIDRLIYVEKLVKQSLIQSLLEMFSKYSQAIVNLIQSKLRQSITSDLANQLNLAQMVTDHYQYPTVDLNVLASDLLVNR